MSGSSIWQMNLCLPMDPPVPEQKCLAYQYTQLGRWPYFGQFKFGRWTFICQWTPHYQSRDACIPVHTTWQMTLLWLIDPPVPKQRCLAYQYIPVHKTWQMNLLWPMAPPLPEQRCLEYQYTILGRWTYFGQWTPKVTEQRCLHTATDI